MARTNATDVKALLGANYNTISAPSVTPYITAANLLVTKANTCAIAKGVTLDATTLEQMELWLAAGYYTRSDPMYKRKKSNKSEGETFGGMYNQTSHYFKTAFELDDSGCLRQLVAGRRGGIEWLGKAPSDQTDYRDRD